MGKSDSGVSELFGKLIGWLLVVAIGTAVTIATKRPANLASVPETAVSDSGVRKISSKIELGPDGKTIEQRMVERRLLTTNSIGQVMFAYIGSADTGQLIYQSVVEGKVVSGGKSLSPRTVRTWVDSDKHHQGGIRLEVGAQVWYTEEVLGDDGVYGGITAPYLFWFYVDGTYHQLYPTDGTFVVVTTRPVDFNWLKASVDEIISDIRAKANQHTIPFGQ